MQSLLVVVVVMGGSSELEVINEIKGVAQSLTLWYRNNCIKVNPDKFHLLLSDKKKSSGGYLTLEAFKYVHWKVFGVKKWQ